MPQADPDYTPERHLVNELRALSAMMEVEDDRPLSKSPGPYPQAEWNALARYLSTGTGVAVPWRVMECAPC
jgi:hypothetical protein